MLLDFDSIPDRIFTFQRRPIPIAGDMRPAWRISLIILIIKKMGNRDTCSLEKLHILSWATRTSETRNSFLDLLNGIKSPLDIIIRCEPALNRAIQYAEAEGLVRINVIGSGEVRVELTDRGRQSYDHIDRIGDCFTDEKHFLNTIRGRVSQQAINNLLNFGGASQ